MKKLLFVVAIAATFTACNSGASTEVKTDSTAVVADSTVVVDSAAVVADSTAVVADSTKVDSTKK